MVNVYSEQQQHLMYVNKQIKDRIDTVLSKQYNIKNGPTTGAYIMYKSPVYYSDNKWKNIIKYIIYQLDFLIQDIIDSRKYYIMKFKVDDNKVIVNAYSPKQVQKFQGNLDMWFNSLEDVQVIIQKQYPEWKYQ